MTHTKMQKMTEMRLAKKGEEEELEELEQEIEKEIINAYGIYWRKVMDSLNKTSYSMAFMNQCAELIYTANQKVIQKLKAQ